VTSSNYYSTRQVAAMAGVHRDTLLRWLREGRVAEPSRDRNHWRTFTSEEAEAIVHYAQATSDSVPSTVKEPAIAYSVLPYAGAVSGLPRLDWDFVDANTAYLTHTIHPYPAKFIPQIPNTLIQELSSVGETVLDPFCGSGTTLVEALRLGRHCVGVDASPLACLISRAKTTRLTEGQSQTLFVLIQEFADLSTQAASDMLPLFPDLIGSVSPIALPVPRNVSDWFEPHVMDELAAIRERCLQIESLIVRELALTAFSSIIVAVSRQDSDTRYVRRDKKIKPGDTLLRFSRALQAITQRAIEFTSEVDARWHARVHQANTLEGPDVGPVDLVVCSPPYPNAYSYHLYHRTRMLWLGMDQPRFKREEIGSHRKYSRKGPGAATSDTFRCELATILSWISRHLRWGRHACFVIGDSVIAGQKIRNDEMLIEVASGLGFAAEANIGRQLQASKKYFNPTIGRIRDEHIVILRNEGDAP
jgi:hypothetical protein